MFIFSLNDRCNLEYIELIRLINKMGNNCKIKVLIKSIDITKKKRRKNNYEFFHMFNFFFCHRFNDKVTIECELAEVLRKQNVEWETTKHHLKLKDQERELKTENGPQ